jgi:hypothetical protein
MRTIILQHLDGEEIARAAITEDEHGYLYCDADGTGYEFEFECALYGYQEGQVSTGYYTDDNNEPSARWVVVEA